MSDGNKPLTEKRLRLVLDEELKQYATKSDLEQVLEAYATKDDLKEAFEENNLKMMKLFTSIMSEFEQRDKDRHEDIKHHLGVLVEEAEERFLKTGHDRISVCEDRLKAHETRLMKVETVVL